jgi:catechol 2,3-dioxygenase-like lactoylglutathione lyase family enzyme
LSKLVVAALLSHPWYAGAMSEGGVIAGAQFILYVRDQRSAAAFYRAVLGIDPSLDVPGMTEFPLGPGSVLGLMPEHGIKKLLGEPLPDPGRGRGIPRAEIYLRVDEPDLFHRRAVAGGAIELSPLARRDWGDEAAYSLDPDGHVLVFARPSHGNAGP